MRKVLQRHKSLWGDPVFIWSMVLSVAFFFASFYINYLAGTYATRKISAGVGDLLLDILPMWDVKWVVIDAATWFLVGIGAILLTYPARIPFIIKGISLFVLVRAFFITLTHIGPYVDLEHQLQPFAGSDFIGKFAFGGDLFFSGHTGLPFLLALAFWKNRFLRFTCLFGSLFEGAAVLIGRYHYSIDVFAAFFITYAIFELCKWLFRNDYALLQGSLSRTGV